MAGGFCFSFLIAHLVDSLIRVCFDHERYKKKIIVSLD